MIKTTYRRKGWFRACSSKRLESITLMADKPGSWSSKLRAHISNLTNRKQKELTRNGTWLWNLNCHLPWHTFSVLNLDLLNCPNSYTNWEPSIRTLKTTGHISFKPPHPFNGISRVDVTNPQSNTSWGTICSCSLTLQWRHWHPLGDSRQVSQAQSSSLLLVSGPRWNMATLS